MNNSASLTPVQGPSTEARIIVISLSQLSHWLHQLPTESEGQWKHQPAYQVSASILEATGRLSHAIE
jgi:hypothetical protein